MCAAPAQNHHTQNIIRVLVVLGVGMIMGDGVLTPAISVVSACEGLQQASTAITRSARCLTPLCAVPYMLLLAGAAFAATLYHQL